MKKYFLMIAALTATCVFIYPTSQADSVENFSQTPKVAEKKLSVPAKETASEEDINRFTNTIAVLKDFYVQPIEDKQLLNSAIRGMVSGLDPHSEYLEQEAYKNLLLTTSGEFGGVGIEIMPEYGVLKIIAPMHGTPAAKAGIKAGDYIVAINNALVSEMNLQEAVEKMRGKAGSEVIFTILRKGETSPLTFTLIRQDIKIESIKSKMLTNNFGYIRITQFQEPTALLMQKAILELKNKNQGKLEGLILDLRNNPGGLLESAVAVTNSFLDISKLKNKFNNIIVYTEGRLPEAQYTAKANAADLLKGAPIIVLINNGSASASEIVAGALQDYRRALIVGTPSFGKGSVQTVIPLDKSHAIKLTTALYHTPAGRTIQNVGITPDIQIEDFSIQPNKQDTDSTLIEPLKEYQLKNHLPGNKNEKLNPQLLNKEDFLLAKKDFQLFQALQILRTYYRLNTL